MEYISDHAKNKLPWSFVLIYNNMNSETRKCYCVLRYLKQDRFTPFKRVLPENPNLTYAQPLSSCSNYTAAVWMEVKLF